MIDDVLECLCTVKCQIHFRSILSEPNVGTLRHIRTWSHTKIVIYASKR
jgi:hypothetical protein